MTSRYQHCLIIVAALLLASIEQPAQGQEIFSTHASATRFGKIDAATGAGTDVGPFEEMRAWAAAVARDGTVYTVAGGQLAKIDASTGGLSLIGPIGTSMVDLEVACDGTIYGLGFDDGVLYRINPLTGAATGVGNSGILRSMDLAIDSNGRLLVVSSFDVRNRVYVVDTTTGAAHFLMNISGIDDGEVMGLMFDNDDRLFATAFVADASLYQVDTETGAATLVGRTGFDNPHGGDFTPNCPNDPMLEIAIDIQPGNSANSVSPRSRGLVSVAVLGSVEFDATQVDSASVVFGPGQGHAVRGGRIIDSNGDGFLDFLLQFDAADAAIACGDTTASLSGVTFQGEPVVGSDAVNTVGCR